jgi:filamentous hemagglutinin
MKLPNAESAVVPSRKITHYLLSTTHRDGQHKAEFFRSFGFKLETWEELASALLEHARKYKVVEVVPTPFGENFLIEGVLPAPDGRSPKVRGVWFIANGQKIATLATAYPLDE